MRIFIYTVTLASLMLATSCKNKTEQTKPYTPQTGSYMGSDGKEHPTVIIDGREYMTVNLDVDTFLNGDPIPEAKMPDEWAKAANNKQAAWCHYENDPENGRKFGRIYNHHTFEDPRGVIPAGWRMVDSSDWERLEQFFGYTLTDQSFAHAVKSRSDWTTGEAGSNASGLNLQPGGMRRENGNFEDKGLAAFFWSPVRYNAQDNYVYYFTGDTTHTERHHIIYTTLSKGNGFYVRLVRDVNQ